MLSQKKKRNCFKHLLLPFCVSSHFYDFWKLKFRSRKDLSRIFSERGGRGGCLWEEKEVANSPNQLNWYFNVKIYFGRNRISDIAFKSFSTQNNQKIRKNIQLIWKQRNFVKAYHETFIDSTRKVNLVIMWLLTCSYPPQCECQGRYYNW